jgi:hypothetical protein
MVSDREELEAITREVIGPGKKLIDLIPQANSLIDFFERITQFRIDPTQDIGAGETRLDSGMAISPILAAMCVRQQFRTLAFIRGLAEAIGDTLQQDRPVRVLYAGCGPYALLAVPLMTFFSHDQVTFTLLDIHQECIDSALSISDSLKLSSHIESAVCIDATRYDIPADRKPDIIVSETMSVCLRNEPQVSIARHLLCQTPEAVMVPQSVSVEMCMMDWIKEHNLMPSDHVGEIPPPKRDRVYLGKIFELDATNIKSWKKIDDDRLPAGRVQIPDSLESRYLPCLLTRITVYGENRLGDYDSSLTIPQLLSEKPIFSGGETVQFHYKLGANPELDYDVLG